MIIAFVGIIVFYLTERIAINNSRSPKGKLKDADMLGFSYQAIPSRHEVRIKLHL